jgi:nitroreductase/NAD-dependent dihydropyrimidine dehydrogenase PreA subunit
MQTDPITIDEDLCQLCGKCAEVCLYQVFEEGQEMVDIVAPECCTQCGHCVSVCPENALSVGEDEPIPLPEIRTITPEQMLGQIRSRRSTRIYSNNAVPRKLIEQVIEAGRYAPTGGNYQSIHFTVVVDPQMIEKLREKVLANITALTEMMETRLKEIESKGRPLSDTEEHTLAISSGFIRTMRLSKEGHDIIFYNAPVVIVLHGEATLRPNQWNADVIAMCMTLMAESLGLGTCFLGYLPIADEVDGEPLRKLINLPDGHRIFQGLIMGYPGLEFVKAPGRKPAKVNWI